MAAPVREAPIIEPGEFLTEEHRIDPFPLYRTIRDWEPVYRDAFQNRFFVSRYADIWDAYKRSHDGGDFTRAIYDPKGKFEFGSDSPLGPTILEMGEGEDHRWNRGVVAGEFVGQAPPEVASSHREQRSGADRTVLLRSGGEPRQRFLGARRGRTRLTVQQALSHPRHRRSVRPAARGLRLLRGRLFRPLLRDELWPRLLPLSVQGERRAPCVPRPNHRRTPAEPRQGPHLEVLRRRDVRAKDDDSTNQGVHHPPPRRRRRHHPQGHRFDVVEPASTTTSSTKPSGQTRS